MSCFSLSFHGAGEMSFEMVSQDSVLLRIYGRITVRPAFANFCCLLGGTGIPFPIVNVIYVKAYELSCNEDSVLMSHRTHYCPKCRLSREPGEAALRVPDRNWRQKLATKLGPCFCHGPKNGTWKNLRAAWRGDSSSEPSSASRSDASSDAALIARLQRPVVPPIIHRRCRSKRHPLTLYFSTGANEMILQLESSKLAVFRQECTKQR